VASKSAQYEAVTPESIEELLDAADKVLDRTKTLYEQYFLGIQKQPPAVLHAEIERRLRDLAQLQIRNTGLRYRLATLQQKFGSYNAYWRRTLRQIENGTYIRNLSKIGREAVRTGAPIPDEILAAMPKRMREQVLRDREAALAIANRRRKPPTTPPEQTEDELAFIREPSALRRGLKDRTGAVVIDESDGDVDLDAFFASIEQDNEPKTIPIPVLTPPGTPLGAAGAPPIPPVPRRSHAPSQMARPNPIAPGAAASKGPVGVESMAGPFPRAQSQPGAAKPAPPPVRPAPPVNPRPVVPPRPQGAPRPQPAPAAPRPPPGMTEADVNALYAKYVKAKEMVGESVGPGGYGKLLKTIHSQAPKIMEQYKARGVDFSIVVKDNQVVIRAKPKL